MGSLPFFFLLVSSALGKFLIFLIEIRVEICALGIQPFGNSSVVLQEKSKGTSWVELSLGQISAEDGKSEILIFDNVQFY